MELSEIRELQMKGQENLWYINIEMGWQTNRGENSVEGYVSMQEYVRQE